MGQPILFLLDVQPPLDLLTRGDTFTIDFELKNTGALPAEDVEVQVLYPEEALELLNKVSYQVSAISAEQPLQRNYEFKALEEGTVEMAIVVTKVKGGCNQPQMIFYIQIRDESSPLLSKILIVTAAVIVITLCLWGTRLMGRRAPSKNSSK